MEEFKSLFEGVNSEGLVLATDCIVCGERIIISNATRVPRMCEKCKAAVMAMRKQMEED